MTSLSRMTSLVLVLFSSFSLSSCMTQPTEVPKWTAPEQNSQVNYPLGSVLDQHSVAEDEIKSVDTSVDPPYNPLRPDNRTPEERIPGIHSRGRIIVGVAQSLNLLGYRDPVTGEMAGFEVDLAKEIARDVFGSPDAIEFRYVESKTRAEALSNHDVDVIFRTMTPTKERQKQLEFSAPYLEVYPRILTHRNTDIQSASDLANKTICVAQDSTSESLVRNLLPHKAILTTLTWSDCLLAMQQWQADAIVTDNAILSGLHAQDPYTTIIDPGISSINSFSYQSNVLSAAMLPPSSSPEAEGLILQVNDTMRRIQRDGTWFRLYQKWLADYIGPASPPTTVYRTEEESKELEQWRKHNPAPTPAVPPTSSTPLPVLVPKDTRHSHSKEGGQS